MPSYGYSKRSSGKKFSKEEVGFEHPAQGPNHCMDCQHFEAEKEACKIVAGVVLASDWCSLFLKESK